LKLKMTKIKCSLTQMCKLVVLIFMIKLVHHLKYKINNKWLVHHLNLMSNQVQVLQLINIARDHLLNMIIGDISRGVCWYELNVHKIIRLSASA
jgi:hypothetical protein